MLLLDSSPGATALLILAAHRALPPFDAVLIPDTGWYPPTGYRMLERLRRVALQAAMGWEPVKTAPIAHRTLNPGGALCPLPLFALHPDGAPGRLPEGCARSTAVALTHRIRRLLGYPRSNPVPGGVVAECATGAGLEHVRFPLPTGPRYVLFRRPLVDIGWTSRDCRALLHHHGLEDGPDMACVACPHRSNHGWARLRYTDSAAFAEAVAVDATLRHDHPEAPQLGMPPGTLYYLHPDRVPLDQADLSTGPDTALGGCVPWACHGRGPDAPVDGGGIR
ncbi:hypothetical protein [Nocardiopsis quinghaiensis]|uniref:hypothetical protein n=1 Tax=Nocardiopsis quinghaiensis TaxID=464995 RepID=UPI001CC2502C|nr:hypothetical protein [Nocardiopsis quinghaiensis]